MTPYLVAVRHAARIYPACNFQEDDAFFNTVAGEDFARTTGLGLLQELVGAIDGTVEASCGPEPPRGSSSRIGRGTPHSDGPHATLSLR